MFKELISILTGEAPLQETSAKFHEMLHLARDLVFEASEIYWAGPPATERVDRIQRSDVKINKLERKIRRQVATSLMTGPSRRAPHNLALISLVKDVERLGDYAKNLVEAASLVGEALPDDPLVDELREIRALVEALAHEAIDVYGDSNRERATELTRAARATARRCDDLLVAVAGSSLTVRQTVWLTLGARYYKRINSHLTNLVSAVIMPLHKLDYFDEKDLQE